MLKSQDQSVAEIGFMLKKLEWGKGYTTQIGEKLIDYGLNELNYKNFIAKVNIDNKKSIKVLEKLKFKECRRDETMIYYNRINE